MKKGQASKKAILLFTFLLVTVSALAFEAPHQIFIQTRSQKIPLQVAYAKDPRVRQRGLKFVTDLADNQGMLFFFKGASQKVFTMKDTPTSLDMLFLSPEKEITYIEENTVPYLDTDYRSLDNTQYVLEVKAGFVKKHGIAIGDKVIF